jgi:Fe-S-cluster containining protein
MKRECGTCALCCKVMGVPEVKQEHQWCPHCKPGLHACKIYPSRPERCRDFHCQWLIDERYPDYWFPAKAKIVINVLIEHGKKYVSFVVDPSYPNRWREDPWFSDIKVIARAGLEGRMAEKWTTIVLIGNDRIPIIGTARLLRGQPEQMAPNSSLQNLLTAMTPPSAAPHSEDAPTIPPATA